MSWIMFLKGETCKGKVADMTSRFLALATKRKMNKWCGKTERGITFCFMLLGFLTGKYQEINFRRINFFSLWVNLIDHLHLFLNLSSVSQLSVSNSDKIKDSFVYFASTFPCKYLCVWHMWVHSHNHIHTHLCPHKHTLRCAAHTPMYLHTRVHIHTPFAHGGKVAAGVVVVWWIGRLGLTM